MSVSEVPRLAADDAAARGLAIEFVARQEQGPPVDGRVGGVRVAKTVVVQRGDEFVFVITDLAARFSWPKLRAVLGVNRVSLPTAEEVLAATGYARGSISPIGAHTPWPVVIDAGLRGERIAVGSGSHGWVVLVEADALARAYGATVADVVPDPDTAGEPAAAK